MPGKRTGTYITCVEESSNNTPSIGAERDDERVTFSGALSLDLTETVNTELAFETIEAVSNLASADFDETVVTFKVDVKY